MIISVSLNLDDCKRLSEGLKALESKHKKSPEVLEELDVLEAKINPDRWVSPDWKPR